MGSKARARVMLNNAEGAGEYRPAEKGRFYRMARRSAAETSAALELLAAIGAIPVDECESAIATLDEIGAMLTTMAKTQEERVSVEDSSRRGGVIRQRRSADHGPHTRPAHPAASPSP
jgi:23S rRNA-intervening sequence protein